MKSFRTNRIVEFGETDMAGIVHFSNFFRFMESAECAFLRSVGLGVALVWEGRHIGFPRVAANCDYLAPARFQDTVDVEVTIARIGQKSVTYAFDFSVAAKAIATGQVTSACCRIAEENRLEAIDIPASYRERLVPYLRVT